MKKIRGNMSAKICAVILLCILVLAFCISSVGIFFGCEYHVYNRSLTRVRESVISDYGSNQLRSRYYNEFNDFYGYRDPDVNFLYSVYEDGVLTKSNYEKQEAVWAGIFYRNEDKESYEWPEYILHTPQDRIMFEKDLKQVLRSHTQVIVGYIPEQMELTGSLYQDLFFLTLIYNFRYVLIGISITSFLLGLLLFFFLMYSAGHRKDSEEIVLRRADRIPYDVFSLVMISLVTICLAGSENLIINSTFIPGVIFCTGLILCGGLSLLAWFMSTSVRVKTHTLLQNTLCARFIRFFRTKLQHSSSILQIFLNRLPLLWRYIVVICAVLLLESLLINAFFNYGDRADAFFLNGIKNLILIPAILYAVLAFDRIRRGTKDLAEGKENVVIDTKYLRGEFLKEANDLNNIRDGLRHAVDERMKSEKFRTELITNVSHDLKTPLTSIINYVELLKSENLSNAKADEYVEVLSRQSEKLKKLTDDLIEVSKASSGTLKTELSALDVCVLMDQTQGEYAERMEQAELELILNKPDAPLLISADGRHMWRIFDNLMNNIVKYALPGTRVYLDASETPGGVDIVFRNISRDPLNSSPEQLMERFARGDSSRHTSGSGLGLSIVQSLTELQGGTTQLSVDGDLFKMRLNFRKAK